MVAGASSGRFPPPLWMSDIQLFDCAASQRATRVCAVCNLTYVRPDVRRWFERRTSAAADWPVDLLLSHKGATTVSVALPALDEAGTVGPIVSTIRRDLMESHGLVDELVVIDSGSTDDTRSAAAAAGATVFDTRDVLPRYGDVPGKGEALWKSLYVTSGDIVVFVDADLEQFTSSFVTGLLGPLLSDPEIAFVKAMYDRPLALGPHTAPVGGGRVTELVARPILNLHWPALAGFVQPLSGEYAARRSVLEALPFGSGYGVEIGLLIDALDVVGLDALAQVDIGQRIHRNQTDRALGRMAVEIWQVTLSRLACEGRLSDADVSTALTQFSRVDGQYVAQTTDVTVTERPPMLSLPEYAARRARAS